MSKAKRYSVKQVDTVVLDFIIKLRMDLKVELTSSCKVYTVIFSKPGHVVRYVYTSVSYTPSALEFIASYAMDAYVKKYGCKIAVLTDTLLGGEEDCWTVEDENGTEPERYNTFKEALDAVKELVEDCQEAVRDGVMDDAMTGADYIIAVVGG